MSNNCEPNWGIVDGFLCGFVLNSDYIFMWGAVHYSWPRYRVIDSIKILDDKNEEWLEVTQPLNAEQDLMFRHP